MSLPDLRHFSINKAVLFAISLGFFSLALAGCDAASNYMKTDRTGSMNVQDYKDAMAPRDADAEDQSVAAGGTIPDLQPYVTSSSTPQKSMPLVSISVNQSVPIRDIIFELAKQADYDIELDPGIKGSIIFTVRDRPLDEVIERIADVAGLRYHFDRDVLRVEMDTPYNKLYKIDYLSYIRTNKGNIRNDIAVVSGDGADTGSAFEATTESESNFWGELDSNMQQILGAQASALRTASNPVITATEENPEVAAVGTPDADGKVKVQAPQAVLKVESLPVDDGAEGDAAVQAATYSINKQAGIINVFANDKAHKEVQAYLDLLRKSATSQVQIEAKILEVTLSDDYQTGIDWSIIDLPGDLATLNFDRNSGVTLGALGVSTTSPFATRGSSFNVGVSGNDVQAFVGALANFGAVKALASPRLTVLNGQSAILNVATNRVFFEVDVDVSTNEGDTTTDISSDIRNVPEGVLVNVIPSVDLTNNTISMAVRPTITRVVDEKPDPAIQYITAQAKITGVESLIPELNVQEIDSVIKVKSGQPIVMGGLLQDRVTGADEGVPVLGEVPMLGSLFKQHVDTVDKTELVIFLQATILPTPGDSVHNTDKDLYRQFSDDRRPFKL
jgi:MSHA biogenesis protein MshL